MDWISGGLYANGEVDSGTGADLSNTSTPFILPGQPGNLVVDYPEWYVLFFSPPSSSHLPCARSYNSTVSGPSGNITINGMPTCNTSALTPDPSQSLATDVFGRRDLGSAAPAYAGANINVNDPPYAIHNGEGRLPLKTIATNATHVGGYRELDTHNLWGTMEEKATREMVMELRPGERPFVVSRSTFAGAGKFTSHWVSRFGFWAEDGRLTEDLAIARRQLQQVVFHAILHPRCPPVPAVPHSNGRRGYVWIRGYVPTSIFQYSSTVTDAPALVGNTDEELCNRWMQLAAFTPFFRNHNIKGAISQEPYVWDSVAAASRAVLKERYRLLPYWVRLCFPFLD